jgi:hypothetical protein
LRYANSSQAMIMLPDPGLRVTRSFKDRNFCNNVCRLLNVIQAYQLSAVDGLVLSQDAEKAFDCVQWSYLFFALTKFTLGDNFMESSVYSPY